MLVGSILGTVLAFFAYRQYYPSLTSPLAHRPYSPRVRRDDDSGELLPSHGLHGSPDAHAKPYSPYEPPTGALAHQQAYAGPANGGSGRAAPEGTVPRGGPQSMGTMWRQGADDERA